MKANLEKNKYFRFFTSGFCEDLPYLLILWVLLSILDFYGWTGFGFFNYAMYFSSWNFLFAYVLILPLPLLKRKWLKRLYLGVIFFIAVASFLVDYFFWIILQGRNYFQITEIVRNTNLTETKEFISHNFDLSLVLPVLALALILYLLFFLTGKIARRTKYNNILGILVTIGCLFLCARNPHPLTDSFWGKMKYWITAFTRETPDLKDYYHDLTVDTRDELPSNLVIIIGESFSRHHSSLYGYEKQTNPHLSEISSQSLFVFPDVESPGLSTLESFKKFMNDSKENGDNREWYECLTIQELLSKSGYHTKWISNQDRFGFFDNDLTAFANLTNEQYFVHDKALRMQTDTYDGEILPLLHKAITDGARYPKNLYWIHLIGSHAVFEKRYPSDFMKFTEKDYESVPAHQRHNMSHYDNSVLYNDYVVSKIIEAVKGEEALVVYFADHGLDIYYTDSEYCYFGRASVPESAKLGSQIPFMIYVSDSLKTTNPEIIDRICMKQSLPLNTNNLIDFIAELLNIGYKY